MRIASEPERRRRRLHAPTEHDTHQRVGHDEASLIRLTNEPIRAQTLVVIKQRCQAVPVVPVVQMELDDVNVVR